MAAAAVPSDVSIILAVLVQSVHVPAATHLMICADCRITSSHRIHCTDGDCAHRYDSFIQLRLIRETAAENQALDLLRYDTLILRPCTLVVVHSRLQQARCDHHCGRLQCRAGLAAESEDATGGPDKFLTAINSARDLLRNASIPSSALPEESLLAVGVEVLAGRLFESISMQVRMTVPLVIRATRLL